MYDLLAGLALGYFMGSFPSAAAVARLSGKNIFEVGSGNMGAMNTARNIGWLQGVIVLLLDIAKGAGAVLAAQVLAGASGSPVALQLMPLGAGVGAVLGHGWSVFTRLRGGKALATAFGVTLPLFPLVGIYGLLILLGLVLLLRRVTLSAILAVASLPVIALLLLEEAGVQRDYVFAAVTALLLMALLIIYRHVRPAHWNRSKRSETSPETRGRNSPTR